MRRLRFAGQEQNSLVDFFRRVSEWRVGEVEAAEVLNCCGLDGGWELEVVRSAAELVAVSLDETETLFFC